MNRFQRLVNVLIAVALLVTAAVFYAIARAQQADIVASHSANRLRHVEQAARDAEEAFHGIAEALRFSARLVQSRVSAVEHTEELAAYLAVVKQYRMINVYDGTIDLKLSVADPVLESPFEPWRFTELMAEAARKSVLQSAGEVFSSRVLQVGDGWYQAFSLGFGPGSTKGNPGVVTILIDHNLYFGIESNRTTESHSNLLLLDDYGKPALPVSKEIATLLNNEQDRPADAQALVQRLRQRQTGTQELGSSHRIAGLGGPDIIAAFAPISARHGGWWVIARLTNAEFVRSEITGAHLRLLLAYVVVLILFLGARLLALDAARRSDGLRERLRQAEQLAHLSEKTNKIIDNIPSGVMSLTGDGRISALNHWLRSRVPASALGQDLRAAFPEATAVLVARLDDLARSALLENKVKSLFGERVALFGEEGQYTLHAVPLESRFPDARLVLVIEDLSEVGSLASQLLRTEKLATVGVLAAGIAHEIGTPLGIVRGRAEYLLGKLGADHAQANGIQVIISQIDLVSRTLRELLDFARVKAVSVRTVSLRTVASAVVELLRFEGSRRSAEISTTVPEDLPALAADPDQLQQVLVNLVINACDACLSRGPGEREPGRVRIHGELPPPAESGEWSTQSLRTSYVNIIVSDNGCGIPRENLNQVFDPFFTTKKRGQGTGLGLTIVAQIVRNHGGSLEIDSEIGRGTRMILKWPISRGSGQDRHSDASIPVLRQGAQTHG